MFVKFKAHYDGRLWCAMAERDDIYAVGETLVELMENVDMAARVHYSGKTRPGEDIHIFVASEGVVPEPPL